VSSSLTNRLFFENMRLRKYYDQSLGFDLLCRKPGTKNAYVCCFPKNFYLYIDFSRKDNSLSFLYIYRFILEFLSGKKAKLKLSSKSILDFRVTKLDPVSCYINFNLSKTSFFFDNLFSFFGAGKSVATLTFKNNNIQAIFQNPLYLSPSFLSDICNSKFYIPPRYLKLALKQKNNSKNNLFLVSNILSTIFHFEYNSFANNFRNYSKYVG
jgi:hypothetical protein